MEFVRRFKKHVLAGYRSPLFPLIGLFLFIQLTFEQSGGTNEKSRAAAVFSFLERGSFRLDPDYDRFTVDWARTPDGAYTSNKAPGPAILAIPIVAPMDAILVHRTESPQERYLLREKASLPFMKISSIILQVIPWALLALVALSLMQDKKFSLRSQTIFLLAFLFGTTSSVFLNTFFGHSLSSVFLLFLFLSLIWGHFYWAGFFFGWALLCDFGVGFLVPGMLFVLWHYKNSLNDYWKFIAGGIFPGIIWSWYHQFYYGSPFVISSKYQNPYFIDLSDKKDALWGVINFFPKWESVGALLYGPQRGLIITQPWVLAVLVALIFLIFQKHFEKFRILAFGFCLAFLGIFWMNASFGGWHGGSAPGPRYLAPSLVLFSLWIPFLLGKMTPLIQKAFIALLIWACIFQAFVMSTDILLGEGPVLPSILNHFSHVNLKSSALLRITVFSVASLWTFTKVQKKLRAKKLA